MTDNTSPVATLAAKLPKGNGLTRAVPQLYDSRGAHVLFVGVMRVEETSIDLNDIEKLKGSIQRFELAMGPLAGDAKDLLTRCSTAATSVTGQMSLLTEDHSNDDEDRRSLIRDLHEWGQEQDPQLDTAALTDLWNSWHGGFYDARLEQAPVRHLREFCIQKGVIAEDTVLAPAFSDSTEDETPELNEDPDDEPGDEQ